VIYDYRLKKNEINVKMVINCQNRPYNINKKRKQIVK
jgi:hypothetical protein